MTKLALLQLMTLVLLGSNDALAEMVTKTFCLGISQSFTMYSDLPGIWVDFDILSTDRQNSRRKLLYYSPQARDQGKTIFTNRTSPASFAAYGEIYFESNIEFAKIDTDVVMVNWSVVRPVQVKCKREVIQKPKDDDRRISYDQSNPGFYRREVNAIYASCFADQARASIDQALSSGNPRFTSSQADFKSYVNMGYNNKKVWLEADNPAVKCNMSASHSSFRLTHWNLDCRGKDDKDDGINLWVRGYPYMNVTENNSPKEKIVPKDNEDLLSYLERTRDRGRDRPLLDLWVRGPLQLPIVNINGAKKDVPPQDFNLYNNYENWLRHEERYFPPFEISVPAKPYIDDKTDSWSFRDLEIPPEFRETKPIQFSNEEMAQCLQRRLNRK